MISISQTPSDPSKNRTCDLLFRNTLEAVEAGASPSRNPSEEIEINRSGPQLAHNGAGSMPLEVGSLLLARSSTPAKSEVISSAVFSAAVRQ